MKYAKPFFLSAALIALLIFVVPVIFDSEPQLAENKLPRIERQKQRTEYFYNKLKDPVTLEIPANVREQELQFSRILKSKSVSSRTSAVSGHEWNEIGPSDVGGRTRAIAIDTRNSAVVLVGGVTGGIWKSTDGGISWASKLPSGSHLSITSIAQDPVSQDTWYATTGEIADGGSASGKSNGYNPHLGAGVYKSTDNGENWEQFTYASDGQGGFVRQSFVETDIARSLISPFQLTSKVVVNDFNGTVAIFVTTQYYGIWLSTDGAESFSSYGGNLVNDEDPTYSDILVDSNDNITIWFGATPSGNNGFFRSVDGGASFFNVTPDSYPGGNGSDRTVMAFAPSNPAQVYAFVHDGSASNASHFFAFDFSTIDEGGTTYSFENRSVNLPDFSRSIFGGSEDFTTQGGYDMILAVHPQDPDFVVLGYVNLIRSTDGFSTAVTSDPASSWIGGNENPWRQDESLDFEYTHHADQHMLLFDPSNPDVLWSGHDGGLSRTANVKANRVIWESMNNDYNVTQYYTVSAGSLDGDSYVIGGTQDNGSPLLDHSDFDGLLIPRVEDVSSGDGAYCFAGDEIIYASAQFGAIAIWSPANDFFDRFFEREDLNRLFIHPFAVDPNDQGTLFYSSNGNGVIARNDQFDEGVAQKSSNTINNGWTDLNFGDAVTISAIKVSDENPSHRLYFGGNLGSSPVLYSLDQANTVSNMNALSGRVLNEVEDGSWLNDIAVNPADGDEILLVYANYNIVGLYHSSDAGTTLTAVEGNLGVNDDRGGTGFSGPSLRAAEIFVDTNGDKKYFVATSIGLFSTESLNGANTTWTMETDLLDNVVVEDLDLRADDGAITVGTHGRGIFMGTVSGSNSLPSIEDQEFTLDEGSPNGTVVGQVVAFDPDGDALTYSLTNGNTSDAFAIDGTTGQLSVNATEALDFSVNPTFSLTIEVMDGTGGSFGGVLVNLVEVNAAPVILPQEFTIDEGSANGTVVGLIAANDSDNDDLTFAITAGNTADAFALDGSTGSLTVKNSNALEFDTSPIFTLTIEVSDGTELASASVKVNLNEKIVLITRTIQPEIYPNPVVAGEFNVSQPGWASKEVKVQISDLMGRVHVSESARFSPDGSFTVSFDRPGYFVILLQSGDDIRSQSLIVK